MSQSTGPIGLFEAMSTLRAVRRLRPDPVPEEVLHRVIEAATWAPSGGNLQPWRVIAVQDPAKKRPLGRLYRAEWQTFARHYQQRLEAIDEEERSLQERILAAGDTLAANFHLTPVLLVFCFHPGLLAITDADLDRPSVVGGGSLYPAVQNCLLACRAEGLGCTLTTLLCLREPEVKKILEIPLEWGTFATVPVGYPVGGGHGPIRRRPVSKMAYRDRWGEVFEPT